MSTFVTEKHFSQQQMVIIRIRAVKLPLLPAQIQTIEPMVG